MKKKIMKAVFAVAIVCAIPASSALADSGGVRGGWSEVEGSFTVQAEQSQLLPTARAAGTVQHTGKSETKSINGTTHKRSHGWTTWSGVYHYTTAQLEHYWPHSGVIRTSGRVWGWNGTEAMTSWTAFNHDAPSNGYGAAKTYYGN
jgi:hypothetical protein